jgi:hypothetical protein
MPVNLLLRFVPPRRFAARTDRRTVFAARQPLMAATAPAAVQLDHPDFLRILGNHALPLVFTNTRYQEY